MTKFYSSLLALAIATASFSASAQDFSASVGVESEYLTRGRDLSNGNPSYNATLRVDNLVVDGLWAEFEANTVWGHPALLSYDPVRTEYELGYTRSWDKLSFTASFAHTRKSLFYSYLPINEVRTVLSYKNSATAPTFYGFAYKNLSSYGVPTDTYYGAGVKYDVTSKFGVGAEANWYNYSSNPLATVNNVFNSANVTASYKLTNNLVANAQYAYVNKSLTEFDLPNQFSVGLKYTF